MQKMGDARWCRDQVEALRCFCGGRDGHGYLSVLTGGSWWMKALEACRMQEAGE